VEKMALILVQSENEIVALKKEKEIQEGKLQETVDYFKKLLSTEEENYKQQIEFIKNTKEEILQKTCNLKSTYFFV
jgi:hypothetical protein